MKVTFGDLPVEQSMIFEEIFEPELQLDLDEKKELLEKCVKIYLFADDKPVGELYAIGVKELLEEEPDEEFENFKNDLAPYTNNCAIYVHSTTILPEFQGKGLGKLLKCYFQGYAEALGFDFIIGHSTAPEMDKLNESLGVRFLSTHENWYGTGRTAKFYELGI